jgi:hypothetical protein
VTILSSSPYTSEIMVEPVARIRLVQSSDDKALVFAIGKANMEPLAVANFRGGYQTVPLLPNSNDTS